MAGLQNARVGKVYKGLDAKLVINQLRLYSQDIGAWRIAIDAARSRINPRRRMLYDLFDNIKIDGHLESVMDKRSIAITNKKLHYVEKDKEGVTNDFIQENVLETPWFYKLTGYAMEQVAFGHSLIEMIPEKGLIKEVELINRANVRPEFGFLMFHYANPDDGIYYREDPYYKNYLLEVGGKKDYGKLMTAAQYVIYKRGGFGDWAQFAELFGMPFRVGKYNAYDDGSRQKLHKALTEMGGAAHAIIPDGTSIEFFDNNGTGKSEVFKDLVHECNSEISKLFLGNTMTTDNGSSKSQSETHKEVEEDVNLSDMIRMEYLFNWEFKQKLIALGYPVGNGGFHYPETKQIPLEKRIAIDMQVAQQVPIADEYWYRTYGVEKGKIKVGTDPKPDPAKPAGKPGKGEKKSPKMK